MDNELRFTVENDKMVRMSGLYQWPTYAGLLEGLPTDKMNERILNEIAEDAKRHIPYCDAVYVIEAEQKPIEYEGKYPFGKPMSLPGIVCVTNLTCSDTVRDKNMDASHLTIVWFQENYAFPIDVEIREKIMQIPWSKVAEDFGY
jgi:hypothetical protein